MGIQCGIGLARDGGTLGIADGNHLGSLLAGVAHGHEGIHGFARLRQGHDEGLFVHDGVAVTELVGKLDLARNTAPVLDGVARNVTGVRGGTAGDDDDLVDGLEY